MAFSYCKSMLETVPKQTSVHMGREAKGQVLCHGINGSKDVCFVNADVSTVCPSVRRAELLVPGRLGEFWPDTRVAAGG